MLPFEKSSLPALTEAELGIIKESTTSELAQQVQMFAVKPNAFHPWDAHGGRRDPGLPPSLMTCLLSPGLPGLPTCTPDHQFTSCMQLKKFLLPNANGAAIL